MSQLALAGAAEISARHLCFLETGRAKPSREMVNLLATALDVGLTDRNAMLIAAGFAPVYGEHTLEAHELEHVRHAFEFVLQQHEPYPAIVIDGAWNVVMRNEGARQIFGLFLRETSLDRDVARNALRVICHPGGLRRFIVNWEEFVAPLMQTIHREATSGPNPAAARLRDELLAYPGMPAAWKTAESDHAASPVLVMRLCRDDVALAFFSMLTKLATPYDVTLEQLRIECFYPADAATDKAVRQLVSA